MTDFFAALKTKCRLLADKAVFSDRRLLLCCGLLVVVLLGWFCFSQAEEPAPLPPVESEESDVRAEAFFAAQDRINRDSLKNPFDREGENSSPASAAKAAAIAPKPGKGPRALSLTGTISGAGGTQAIIKSGKAALLLFVGEEKDGVTLVSVSEDGQSAVIRENGRERELWLGR